MTENSYSTKNILVVDDEVFALKFVTRILGKLGVGEVSTVDDGQAALELLRNSDVCFDLVISDIEMPGINGYELVEKIRSGEVPDYKDVPILILTGQDKDTGDLQSKFDAINGFITKPPTADKLETSLSDVFGR